MAAKRNAFDVLLSSRGLPPLPPAVDNEPGKPKERGQERSGEPVREPDTGGVRRTLCFMCSQSVRVDLFNHHLDAECTQFRESQVRCRASLVRKSIS